MRSDDLRKIGQDIGIFWRSPKNKFENFIELMFRNYRWARRLLGGRWECVVHDKGSLHFVISWFWVEKWSVNEGAYRDALVGRELWANGRKLDFDFGTESGVWK